MKFEYEPSWDHTLDSFKARQEARRNQAALANHRKLAIQFPLEARKMQDDVIEGSVIRERDDHGSE